MRVTCGKLRIFPLVASGAKPNLRGIQTGEKESPRSVILNTGAPKSEPERRGGPAVINGLRYSDCICGGGNLATSGDAWIEQWLSGDRFALYVRKSGGDRKRALALYEWNAKLSAAFLHDLNHLEVALRNAYDQQLVPATLQGDKHWTDRNTVRHLFPPHMRRDHNGKLVDANRIPRSQITAARSSAGSTPSPGKVVAELMFGFWTYMTSDLHEKTLWVPHLHKAFAPNTDRSKIHGTLTDLRSFRNRVAHHEPILTAPEGKRRQLVSAMRQVRPEALNHFTEHSEVSTILTARP